MIPVTQRLREVRQAARPRMTVRAMADAMGLPLGTYARYESGYKKRQLPLEFARQVATVLSDRGVDPADVMALAGLTDGEALPEAEAITSHAPAVQYVQMAVAMPSANALQEMFDVLLRGFPDEVPDAAMRRVLAQGLARRLPIALAQLQGPLFELDEDEAPLPAAATPPPATARRGQPSRPSS